MYVGDANKTDVDKDSEGSSKTGEASDAGAAAFGMGLTSALSQLGKVAVDATNTIKDKVG